VDNQFIVFDKLHQLTSKNDLLEALIERGQTSRISINLEDPLLYRYVQFQFSQFRIPCLEPQAISRTPPEWADFQKALNYDAGRIRYLAGVSALVIPGNMVQDVLTNPAFKDNISGAPLGYDVVPNPNNRDPSHSIINLRSYLPKASFVPADEFLPDHKSLMARLGDPKWIATKSVLFEKGVSTSPTTSIPVDNKPGPPPSVAIVDYTSTKIVIVVDNPRPGYILIDDAFDPGWHAKIDNKPAPIYRADIMMRAIPISNEGSVVITLNYDPTIKLFGQEVSKEYYNLACDGLAVGLTLACLIALSSSVLLKRSA
jgi:hypothetical protein